MASGRRVNLHHGARFVLAESLGVSPGLLCRRANTIVVAKTPGFIMSPAWEIDCRVLERVGILPVEYYTDMIVMWSENYDVQIGMDSSVIVGGDVAFDLEKRDIVKIDYIVGHRPIVFHSGWIACAPVCLTLGRDYRFAPNLVLLRAAPFAFSVSSMRINSSQALTSSAWTICRMRSLVRSITFFPIASAAFGSNIWPSRTPNPGSGSAIRDGCMTVRPSAESRSRRAVVSCAAGMRRTGCR